MKKLIGIIIITFTISIFCTFTANAEEVIDNGYIVKLNNDISLLSANNSDFISLGNGLYKVNSELILGALIEEKMVSKFFSDYALELYDIDYPQTTSDTKISEQWNLPAIKAECSRTKGIFGEGVKIAVIDSGLNVAHSDLNKKNIMQGYNCIDVNNVNSDTNDIYGHGTEVTGIIAAQIDNQNEIAGIASEANIIPIKVTDGKKLSLSSIYLGINKAIEANADIINMSLGGYLTDVDAIQEFKLCIDKAIKKGCIVVAAVGNGGTQINYPAVFDNVIGVGSVDKNLEISEYSQYNESVLVTAPGVDILSLSNMGGTILCTGTSYSAPQISAVAALVKEVCPEYTYKEFCELLINTSDDLGNTGYDIYYGYGIVNIEKIFNEIQAKLPKYKVSQGIKNDVMRIYIHNNSNKNIELSCYFAKYLESKLNNLLTIQDKNIAVGVNSIDIENKFDYFMLWDKNLCPQIPKYKFK